MLVSKVHCELCGGEFDRRSSILSSGEGVVASGESPLDDLAAAIWVQAYDAAWLGRDWGALERYFARDVVVMLAGFSVTITGRAAVLAHLRAMMCGAEVHEYNATDLRGHSVREIGVITYRWQLDCTVDHHRRATSGRDILVLRRAHEGWQLVWRVQMSPNARAM